jgi:hypothetical protein
MIVVVMVVMNYVFYLFIYLHTGLGEEVVDEGSSGPTRKS